MRQASILLSLLFSMNAFAQSDISELPTYICDSGDCSVKQLQILKKFEKATSAKINSQNVYSGECYHLSASNDANQVQYGMAYIVPKNGDLFWDGQFSFFYENNPYKDLSAATAREKFGNIEENEKNKFSILKDYLFINYGDEENFTRYWMRTNSDQSHLFVLGYWGIDHRVLCDFSKN